MSKGLDLHKLLLKKEADVLGTERPEYKTNGEFRPSLTSQRGMINIKITTGTTELIEVYKALKFHEEAAKELGLSNTKHLGYTVAEWMHDIKLRAAVLRRNQTLSEIEQLKLEIEDILTTKEIRDIKSVNIEERLNKLDPKV